MRRSKGKCRQLGLGQHCPEELDCSGDFGSTSCLTLSLESPYVTGEPLSSLDYWVQGLLICCNSPEAEVNLFKKRSRQRELAFHSCWAAEQIKALLGRECFLTDHPGVKVAGLEFAVGSVRYPTERGEGFGFAESSLRNTFSQGLAAFGGCMGDAFLSMLFERGCKAPAACSELPSAPADGMGLQSIPMVLGLILSHGCSGVLHCTCRRNGLTALTCCSSHNPGTL